jgi:DNA-binding transcriptional LysR family regulator
LIDQHIAAGRLVPVLQDWWPDYPGYRLYYTSRRQASPALALVIEALRFTG